MANEGIPNGISEIFDGPEDIVEHVFRQLPMKSLHQCARVCKRWNLMANRVKRSRKQHAWLLYNEDLEGDSMDQVGHTMEVLSFFPKHCLTFCTTTQFDDRGVSVPSQSATRHFRKTKKDKMNTKDYLHKILPRSCRLYGVVADGIVGTRLDSGRVEEAEGNGALSCLLLPETPSGDNALWRLYRFHVDSETDSQLLCTANTGPPDPERLAAVTGIPRGERPKVILLFYTEGFMHLESEVLGALMRGYAAPVAGGYVDNIFSERDGPDASDGPEPLALGLAFCGDAVKVASVVVSSRVRSKKEVERSLLKFRDSHIPQDNTLGFMFACIGRGRHHYKENNVEADAFRRLFPRVPLLGLFGNGELGFQYVPDYSKPQGDTAAMSLGGQCGGEGWRGSSEACDLPELLHSYTTIFVMLHLGSKDR